MPTTKYLRHGYTAEVFREMRVSENVYMTTLARQTTEVAYVIRQSRGQYAHILLVEAGGLKDLNAQFDPSGSINRGFCYGNPPAGIAFNDWTNYTGHALGLFEAVGGYENFVTLPFASHYYDINGREVTESEALVS